ncbi:MAG: hypothetical protein AAFY48_10955 [Bacteroidota bacterium]
MPIEILTHSTSLDGNLPQFKFSNPITHFVYGISGFNVGYGSDTDHHLETFKISFIVNQPTSDTVELSPAVEFHDNSGHHDVGSSSISVTVIAWFDEDNLVKFTNTPAIASGNNYRIASKQHAFSLASFVAGFDLSYGDHVDHHVETMGLATTSSQEPGVLMVGAEASMYDASGNQSLNPTVSAGVIASYLPDAGFEMQVVQGTITPQKPLTVQFHRDIDQAALLLVDFNLSYGNEDHHIENVIAGYLPTPGFPQINGSTASFYLTGCDMNDNSGNKATRRKYHMLAIGRYAQ